MSPGSNDFSTVHYKLGCFKRKKLQMQEQLKADLQRDNTAESSPATEVKTEQLSEQKCLNYNDNSEPLIDKDEEEGLH